MAIENGEMTVFAAGEQTLNIGLLKGAQFLPIAAMQNKGLDRKYGLNLNVMPLATPMAISIAIAGHQVDVCVDPWQRYAVDRSKGGDPVVIGPLSNYEGQIIVKKDSPARSVNDLQGNKLGALRASGVDMALVVRYALLKELGFDINSKLEMREGAIPLLLGLLDKGDLDAVWLGGPSLVRSLAGGKYREIWDLGISFKKLGKNVPLQLCVISTDQSLKTKREALKKFMAAYAEAKDILITDRQIWKELAKEVDIKGDEAVEILQKRLQPTYVQTWNKGFTDNEVKFSQEMHALHKGALIIPDKIPEGLFSFSVYSK